MLPIGRLAGMLGLLALGALGRRAGVLAEARRDRLNAVAFYVAIPALVFDSTLGRPLRRIVTPDLLLGVWLVLGAAGGLAWLVHRSVDDPAVRSVATVQSYHSNFGFLGLPLVVATLGEAAGSRAVIVLGIGALTQIPATIAVLVWLNDADASVAGEARDLATNPVLLALGLAVVAVALDLGVPGPVRTALGAVATLALPLAMVLVGSALEVDAPATDRETLAAVVGLKVLVVPVLAWIAFTAVGADPLVRAAGVVMFGAPAAVSTFVYATELGGDAEFASVGVFTTTIVSLPTLGIAVWLVG